MIVVNQAQVTMSPDGIADAAQLVAIVFRWRWSGPKIRSRFPPVFAYRN